MPRSNFVEAESLCSGALFGIPKMQNVAAAAPRAREQRVVVAFACRRRSSKPLLQVLLRVLGSNLTHLPLRSSLGLQIKNQFRYRAASAGGFTHAITHSRLQAFPLSRLQAFTPSRLQGLKPSTLQVFTPSSLRAFTPSSLHAFQP
jgi:hypothetical protein